jgi:hypothetical protein
MKAFADTSEITDLTNDLPIYLLQRMPLPEPKIVNELVLFLEHRMSLAEDNDLYWDLRMSNALSVICHARHPEALAIALELFNWVDDASPFLQHKALRLLETLLDAETYAPQARRWLKGMKTDQDLYLPLLMLAARLHDGDELTRSLILDFWEKDAAVSARLMGLTQDGFFLEHLETTLAELAPFLRYLPPHEVLPPLAQHELWSEVAEAWFAVAHAEHLTPPWLDPALLIQTNDVIGYNERAQEWQEQLDAHLMERFGGAMNTTEEQWLKSLENNDLREQFIEARQYYKDLTKTGPKRLRLVTPETSSI